MCDLRLTDARRICHRAKVQIQLEKNRESDFSCLGLGDDDIGVVLLSSSCHSRYRPLLGSRLGLGVLVDLPPEVVVLGLDALLLVAHVVQIVLELTHCLELGKDVLALPLAGHLGLHVVVHGLQQRKTK